MPEGDPQSMPPPEDDVRDPVQGAALAALGAFVSEAVDRIEIRGDPSAITRVHRVAFFYLAESLQLLGDATLLLRPGDNVFAHARAVSGILRALVDVFGRQLAIWTASDPNIPDGRFVIESPPIRDKRGRERGVVAEGPVGTRWAGRSRLFRYEIRRWRGGSIPDANEAVGGPVRVANDPVRAQRVLDLVPSVPTPVWGRDELDTRDMWNSNSLVSWLLVRAGVATEQIQPPSGGRAPGWDAGIVVARREI